MALICVDSNIVAKLLIPEDDSDIASDLWRNWARDGEVIVGPSLMSYEVTNILRKAVTQGRTTVDASRRALEGFFALSLTLFSGRWIHARALPLALDHSIASAYDAHYLAVARELGATLWTADRRLYEAAEASATPARLFGS